MTPAPVASKPETKTPATEPTITAWKGFDADLKCRGHQFTVGQTYTHSGKVVACSSGFHSCENPLDVWSYYDLASSNRFCRVHAGGEVDRHRGDSKLASSVLTIVTEVTFGEMIRAGVKWEIKAALAKAENNSATNASAGDSATNASAGDSATNASAGNSATNASAGNFATNASAGDSATNASAGEFARNASAGNFATNASAGDSATNASAGEFARNASAGEFARNASAGDSARNASAGDSATNASAGEFARNASAGNFATNASAGDSATNASAGEFARNEAAGANSVIAAAGLSSRAKGAIGTAIAQPYKDAIGQIRFATGVVGEDGIPPDTWLISVDGKLVRELAA